eukprot:7300284-Prymnesium_polylepis.1
MKSRGRSTRKLFIVVHTSAAACRMPPRAPLLPPPQQQPRSERSPTGSSARGGSGFSVREPSIGSKPSVTAPRTPNMPCGASTRVVRMLDARMCTAAWAGRAWLWGWAALSCIGRSATHPVRHVGVLGQPAAQQGASQAARREPELHVRLEPADRAAALLLARLDHERVAHHSDNDLAQRAHKLLCGAAGHRGGSRTRAGGSGRVRPCTRRVGRPQSLVAACASHAACGCVGAGAGAAAAQRRTKREEPETDGFADGAEREPPSGLQQQPEQQVGDAAATADRCHVREEGDQNLEVPRERRHLEA